MIGKCNYCGIQIDESNIQCDKCDIAWENGVRFGKNEVRNKLKEIFNTLINLSKGGI